MKAMPVPDGRVDLAAAEKQSRKVLHKQDKLLLQGFSLLLNLAEDGGLQDDQAQHRPGHAPLVFAVLEHDEVQQVVQRL